MKLAFVALIVAILATLSQAQVFTGLWYCKYELYTFDPFHEWDQEAADDYFARCAAPSTQPTQFTSGFFGYVFWASTEVQMALPGCSREEFEDFINKQFVIAEWDKTATYNAADCLEDGKPICGQKDAKERCEACNNGVFASTMIAVVIAALAVFSF